MSPDAFALSGRIAAVNLPRAMPWAMRLLGFQPAPRPLVNHTGQREMATSLTKADVGLLRYGLPEGVTLHMYPDNDEPGMKLFEDLRRWFPELQGHVLPEGYKDFGQWWAKREY